MFPFDYDRDYLQPEQEREPRVLMIGYAWVDAGYT